MLVPDGPSFKNSRLTSAASFRTARSTMIQELRAECMHRGVWVGSVFFRFAWYSTRWTLLSTAGPSHQWCPQNSLRSSTAQRCLAQHWSFMAIFAWQPSHITASPAILRGRLKFYPMDCRFCHTILRREWIWDMHFFISRPIMPPRRLRTNVWHGTWQCKLLWGNWKEHSSPFCPRGIPTKMWIVSFPSFELGFKDRRNFGPQKVSENAWLLFSTSLNIVPMKNTGKLWWWPSFGTGDLVH